MVDGARVQHEHAVSPQARTEHLVAAPKLRIGSLESDQRFTA